MMRLLVGGVAVAIAALSSSAHGEKAAYLNCRVDKQLFQKFLEEECPNRPSKNITPEMLNLATRYFAASVEYVLNLPYETLPRMTDLLEGYPRLEIFNGMTPEDIRLALCAGADPSAHKKALEKSNNLVYNLMFPDWAMIKLEKSEWKPIFDIFSLLSEKCEMPRFSNEMSDEAAFGCIKALTSRNLDSAVALSEAGGDLVENLLVEAVEAVARQNKDNIIAKQKLADRLVEEAEKYYSQLRKLGAQHDATARGSETFRSAYNGAMELLKKHASVEKREADLKVLESIPEKYLLADGEKFGSPKQKYNAQKLEQEFEIFGMTVGSLSLGLWDAKKLANAVQTKQNLLVQTILDAADSLQDAELKSLKKLIPYLRKLFDNMTDQSDNDDDDDGLNGGTLKKRHSSGSSKSRSRSRSIERGSRRGSQQMKKANGGRPPKAAKPSQKRKQPARM